MPLCIYKTRFGKQGKKTLKPLISQGFQVSASILVTQDVMRDQFRCMLKIGKIES